MDIRFGQTGYGSFDERARIGPACWPHFDLLWVHGGSVAIRFMDEPLQSFDAGRGVLIYPDTPFEGDATTRRARASIQHFAIESRPGRSAMLEPFGRLRGVRQGYERLDSRQPERIDEWIDRAMELSRATPSPLIQSLSVARLTMLLAELELERSDPASPGMGGGEGDRFDALIERMRCKPEAAWSLPEMAKETELSVSHFRAMFRERVGVSPGRFHQELRMGEAARLLRDTDTPIKRIGVLMGFSDLPHFHRRFKQVYGRTPREYRDSRSPRA